MVERSPGGSLFAGPGITCDFAGKRRGGRGKRPVLSAFSRPAGMLVFGGVLLAPERAFPKTGQVINLAGLTGREADFPNASPEAGSGEFQKGRRPFRVPGRAATTESKKSCRAYRRRSPSGPVLLKKSKLSCGFNRSACLLRLAVGPLPLRVAPSEFPAQRFRKGIALFPVWLTGRAQHRKSFL